MKRHFGHMNSSIGASPHVALFVMVIPALAAFIVLSVFKRYWDLSEEFMLFMTVGIIAGTGLYLWICSKNDKAP